MSKFELMERNLGMKNTANPINLSFKNRYLFLLACLIGFLSFVSIYGLSPINPFCDNFIFYTYDEHDINQHYAGWTAFFSDNWHFPLGYTDKIAFGTIISYTDSIPLLAIIFKFIFKLINYQDTFQYFGLYTLFCYIMQAFATGLLVERKCKNLFVIALSMVLLCFSPILMERAFRHTALGSQFLILLAIYALLKGRDEKYRRFSFLFVVLGCVSISTHPYFLPLVFGFAFVYLIESARYGQKNCVKNNVIGFFISIVVTLLVGYVIGVIGHGVSVVRDGFGFYSMNLNAIVNPISCGGYNWSAFNKVHPQILGNYDGFNYLGLGNLLLIFTVSVIAVICYQKEKLKSKFVKNKYLIGMCIFMAAFAVSNVVTFNEIILFTVPLPNFILKCCQIFRASSRIFYGPYYCIVISGIYAVISLTSVSSQLKQRFYHSIDIKSVINSIQSKTTLVISLFVILQLIDLHIVVKEKHQRMTNNNQAPSIELSISTEQMKKYKHINSFEWWNTNRNISIIAGKNNLTVDYPIANSGWNGFSYVIKTRIWSNLVKGNHDTDTVYVTKNEEFADQLIKINTDLIKVKFQDSILLYPTVKKELNLDNSYVIDINDQNWQAGINKSKQNEVAVFKDDVLLKKMDLFNKIICNGKQYIIDSYSEDNNLIVKLKSSAKSCAYPAIITFK